MQQSQEQTPPASKPGARAESGQGTETASGLESAPPSESSNNSHMWPPDSPCLITHDIRPGSAPAKFLSANPLCSNQGTGMSQQLIGPGVDVLLDPEANNEIISSWDLRS